MNFYKKKLVIVPIEPIETRYTGQWYRNLPGIFSQALGDDIEVIQIDGEEIDGDTSEGAFINFESTNIYKSSQLNKICKMLNDGEIPDGSYILFTDAWNPSILNLKYIISLTGKKIRMGGMWHAGSYDPWDFLGRVEDKKWMRSTELAISEALDDNFFATLYHMTLFKNTFNIENLNGFERVGWPMEYLKDEVLDDIDPEKLLGKENYIIFPHRLSEEKNIDFFYEVMENLPGWEWIIPQEKKLTKEEYHKLLAKSKFVFSSSFQETLGISWFEGVIAKALPVVPDRLSYSEIFMNNLEYLYDNTDSPKEVAKKILELDKNSYGDERSEWMKNKRLDQMQEDMEEKYFSSNLLVEKIKSKLLL